MTEVTKVKDKNDWPIVVGARVLYSLGFVRTKLLPLEKHSQKCVDRYAEYVKKWGKSVDRYCDCPRETEDVEAEEEGVVVSVRADFGVYGPVVDVRDTTTHGLFTKLPQHIRVMRGETKSSRLYREATDPAYRAVTKARRNANKGARS